MSPFYQWRLFPQFERISNKLPISNHWGGQRHLFCTTRDPRDHPLLQGRASLLKKVNFWEEQKSISSWRIGDEEVQRLRAWNLATPKNNTQTSGGPSDIIRLVIYCCRFFCREQYFLFRSNHKLKTANYIWQKLTDYVPTIWQSEVVRNENSVTSGAKQSRDLSSVVISISSSTSQSWVSSCKTQWKYPIGFIRLGRMNSQSFRE